MSEINIKCPECKEGFSVSSELMGETMECGACDHTFELSDANLKVAPARHYPRSGKKGFESFTRSTPEIKKDEKASVRAVAYHQQVDVSAVMPLGSIRILAIVAGLAIPILVVLIFVLGSGDSGVLSDVPDAKRWVLVGFIVVLSGLLTIYGFRKNRAVGVIVALVFAGALLSLPVVYPDDVIIMQDDDDVSAEVEVSEEEVLALYKKELGYATIQNKITDADSAERVVAIVLKGVKPVHLDTIKAYLSQSLDSDQYPSEYKERRVHGQLATLLVYTQVNMSIDQLAGYMYKFASDTKVRTDLRIIEIDVDLDTLTVNNASELNDESKPEFYLGNLLELKNIDRSRQLSAIQRIGLADKVSRRSDIEGQLLVLLQEKNYPHRAQIINALVKWAGDDCKSSNLVRAQALELIAKQKEIPQSTLNYCVKYDFPQAGEILVYAWKLDRVVHEETLVLAGAKSEAALLPELENLEPILLESAANVLRKVGTEKSLSTLVALHESSTGVVKKSLKATIDEIKSRR